MQTPSGLTAEAWKLDNPVKCERRLPRAPSDMLAVIAIRHGLDPDAAETSKHRLRLVADIAVVGASTSWVCAVARRADVRGERLLPDVPRALARGSVLGAAGDRRESGEARSRRNRVDIAGGAGRSGGAFEVPWGEAMSPRATTNGSWKSSAPFHFKKR